nr:MAG TPA: hypothetical protein [Caudoviricetes sp.]
MTGSVGRGKNKQLKNQLLSNCKEGGGVIPLCTSVYQLANLIHT